MRVLSYDALRVFAAFLVVGTHVSATLFVPQQEPLSADFFMAASFNAFTRMAVPIFVMLSGAFVLADVRHSDFAYFYRKAWKKLGIPTLIWSVGYVGFQYVFVALRWINEHPVQWDAPLRMALHGQPYYHLWFLYMLLGLYALVPLLVRLISKIRPLSLLGLSVFLCVGSAADESLPVAFWGLQWIRYLGLFILGYVIKNELDSGTLPAWMGKWFRGRSWVYGSLCLASVGTLLFLMEAHFRLGWKLPWLWYFSNQSPTVQIAAISCFLCFARANLKSRRTEFQNSRTDFQKWISRLAEQSFFIYLIHAGLLHLVLYGFLVWHIHVGAALFLPLGTGLIFGISFLLGEAADHFRKKIKKYSE